MRDSISSFLYSYLSEAIINSGRRYTNGKLKVPSTIWYFKFYEFYSYVKSYISLNGINPNFLIDWRKNRLFCRIFLFSKNYFSHFLKDIYGFRMVHRLPKLIYSLLNYGQKGWLGNRNIPFRIRIWKKGKQEKEARMPMS
jgi:hypothetical protein